MGLSPAHVNPMSVAANPKPRRGLSQFFFAGLLDKTEKAGQFLPLGYAQTPRLYPVFMILFQQKLA
ncbi:MAG: hypothetical protein BWY09_00099 [Candidatus Hydrogenedentes bacterium ADurb.Bin179]|nr:MAG: hypothetical protein BWY09_00099 [Candidatus Hydrogenedentes bacterium ADurb.Bin179]